MFDRRGDGGLEILKETGTADTNNSTILLNKSIKGSGSVVLDGYGAVMERDCPAFPTTRPSVKIQFTNQDNDKIDDGYDSKGELLHISEGLCKMMKMEIQTKIGNYNKSFNSKFTQSNTHNLHQ